MKPKQRHKFIATSLDELEQAIMDGRVESDLYVLGRDNGTKLVVRVDDSYPCDFPYGIFSFPRDLIDSDKRVAEWMATIREKYPHGFIESAREGGAR